MESVLVSELTTQEIKPSLVLGIDKLYLNYITHKRHCTECSSFTSSCQLGHKLWYQYWHRDYSNEN